MVLVIGKLRLKGEIMTKAKMFGMIKWAIFWALASYGFVLAMVGEWAIAGAIGGVFIGLFWGWAENKN